MRFFSLFLIFGLLLHSFSYVYANTEENNITETELKTEVDISLIEESNTNDNIEAETETDISLIEESNTNDNIEAETEIDISLIEENNTNDNIEAETEIDISLIEENSNNIDTNNDKLITEELDKAEIMEKKKTLANSTKKINNIETNKITEIHINEGEKEKFKPGELLIKFKNNNTKQTINSINSLSESLKTNYNIKKKKDLSNNIGLYKIQSEKTVKSMIEELKQNPNIEHVQPNFQYYPRSVTLPNDPYFDYLWGLHNTGQTGGTANVDVDAPEAWDVFSANEEIIIAVIDTGVAYTHEDLKDVMWDGSITCKDENNNLISEGCPNHGWEYLTYENNSDPFPEYNPDPEDNSYQHGTHVAGTIAATHNNIGVAGITKGVKLMALQSDLSTASLVNSIAFAQNNDAKIINASWGSYLSSLNTYDSYDQNLYNAIKDFPGLFVVAAGNCGFNREDGLMSDNSHYKDECRNVTHIHTPGYFSKDTSLGEGLDNIIEVAATTNTDELAYFSDYGGNTVHIGAPGYDIYSTIPPIGPYTSAEVIVADFSNDYSNFNFDGNWGIVNETFDGKTNYIKTDINNTPYAHNANYYATSPTIDLSGQTNAKITFSANCDTEKGSEFYDYIDFKINNDIFSTFDEDTLGSSSTYSGWKELSFTLSSKHFTDSFQFSFHWTTDSTNTGVEAGGCLIDDIKIKSTDYNQLINSYYLYKSGTSMATPQVAGLAGMLMSFKPNKSITEIKDAILNTGDPVTALQTTTITGRRINAYNAINSLNQTAVISGTVSYVSELNEGTPVLLPADMTTVLANIKNFSNQDVLTPIKPTDNTGAYSFEVDLNQNYNLSITKNTETGNNGIDTSDAYSIINYIFGNELHPYQCAAADINNDNIINVIDILFILNYGVGKNNIPNNWEFFDSSVSFDCDTLSARKTVTEINNFTSDSSNHNFVGVKMGDVNLSWQE